MKIFFFLLLSNHFSFIDWCQFCDSRYRINVVNKICYLFGHWSKLWDKIILYLARVTNRAKFVAILCYSVSSSSWMQEISQTILYTYYLLKMAYMTTLICLATLSRLWISYSTLHRHLSIYDHSHLLSNTFKIVNILFYFTPSSFHFFGFSVNLMKCSFHYGNIVRQQTNYQHPYIPSFKTNFCLIDAVFASLNKGMLHWNVANLPIKHVKISSTIARDPNCVHFQAINVYANLIQQVLVQCCS